MSGPYVALNKRKLTRLLVRLLNLFRDYCPNCESAEHMLGRFCLICGNRRWIWRKSNPIGYWLDWRRYIKRADAKLDKGMRAVEES